MACHIVDVIQTPLLALFGEYCGVTRLQVLYRNPDTNEFTTRCHLIKPLRYLPIENTC